MLPAARSTCERAPTSSRSRKARTGDRNSDVVDRLCSHADHAAKALVARALLFLSASQSRTWRTSSHRMIRLHQTSDMPTETHVLFFTARRVCAVIDVVCTITACGLIAGRSLVAKMASDSVPVAQDAGATAEGTQSSAAPVLALPSARSRVAAPGGASPIHRTQSSPLAASVLLDFERAEVSAALRRVESRQRQREVSTARREADAVQPGVGLQVESSAEIQLLRLQKRALAEEELRLKAMLAAAHALARVPTSEHSRDRGARALETGGGGVSTHSVPLRPPADPHPRPATHAARRLLGASPEPGEGFAEDRTAEAPLGSRAPLESRRRARVLASPYLNHESRARLHHALSVTSTAEPSPPRGASAARRPGRGRGGGGIMLTRALEALLPKCKEPQRSPRGRSEPAASVGACLPSPPALDSAGQLASSGGPAAMRGGGRIIGGPR